MRHTLLLPARDEQEKARLTLLIFFLQCEREIPNVSFERTQSYAAAAASGNSPIEGQSRPAS